ncbi:MAG TPA: heavy-metal-associated domain-containing protein [Firmicutes bacterium]|nr:heavy-metal-associated domain-containing protein [Candidatus Fermentithermobacillaceae bacterium]
MHRDVLRIPNIGCDHCVMVIKKELGKIAGVKKVEGDARTKMVTVEWDQPATLEQIKSSLRAINYPAED